jgi:hypothetical protein
VSYPTGWNQVAGPAGTALNGNTGPLYSFPAGNTDYQLVPNGSSLQPGQGYWAYFPSTTTITLASGDAKPVTMQLPAGQYVLVGNPGSTTAGVTGADSLRTFDPVSNGYAAATTLKPGQGAWAISMAGGTLTIGGGLSSELRIRTLC